METVTPRIETLEQTDVRGKFVVEPLEPGYGVTLGNSLRRVLLSSIEGAAITSVKIEGVQHEFQTIPGLKEDATRNGAVLGANFPGSSWYAEAYRLLTDRGFQPSLAPQQETRSIFRRLREGF